MQAATTGPILVPSARVVAAFKELPLSFIESPAEERSRLGELQKEDPIALQDVLNTSQALVQAARLGDLEELHSVIENAEAGELLHAFVLQAFVVALKNVSLETVKALVRWGVPLDHDSLAQSLHLVCELTTRNNFSDAWRIVEVLINGNSEVKMSIDQPRIPDGWTPLCVACADGCLPLAFKLLDLGADPNVITRQNKTPIALAKQKREDDTAEQREGRGIIVNMLQDSGGQESWRDALAAQTRPGGKRAPAEPVVHQKVDGSDVIEQKVSQTHTRFSA